MPNDPSYCWISKIEISNFRGYGGDFKLDIPFKNGVVLLSGPNGLGKTSLFEAIEWTLTSKIRRLDTLLSRNTDHIDEIVRDVEGVTAASASVSFVDSNDKITTFRRTQTGRGKSALVGGSELSEIIGFLRASERWLVSEDSLSNYLYLTHIHPQSARIRIISSKPKERYSWFSHLAGTEKLSELAATLTATKKSLTEAVQFRHSSVEKAERELARWKSNLNSFEKLKNRVSSSGEHISADDALVKIQSLQKKIAIDVVEWDHSNENPIETVVLDGFKTLFEWFEKSIKKVNDNIARKVDFEPSIVQWSTTFANSEDLKRRKTHLDNSIKESTNSLNKETNKSKEIEKILKSTEQETLTIKNRYDLIKRSYEDKKKLPEVHNSLQEAKSNEPEIKKKLEAIEKEISALVKSQEIRNDLTTRLKSRKFEIESLGIANDSHEKISNAYNELRRLNSKVLERAKELTALDSQISAAKEKLRSNEDVINKTQQNISSHTAKIGAIEEAVAVIASHIEPTDVECPVCKTEHETGKLQLLASKSTESISPAVRGLQIELSSLRKLKVTFKDAISNLEKRKNEIIAETQSLKALQKNLESQVEKLSEQEVFHTHKFEDVPGAIAKQLEIANKDLIEIEAKSKQIPSPTDLSEQLKLQRSKKSWVESELKNSQLRTLKFSRQVDELTESARRLEKFSLKQDIESEISKLMAEISQADDKQSRAEKQMSDVQLSIEKIQGKISHLKKQTNEVTSELESADAKLDQLRKFWISLKFSGDPSPSLLEKSLIESRQSLTTLNNMNDDVKDLSDKFSNWINSQELIETEANLKEEAGDKSFTEYSKFLTENVDAESRAYESAKTIRENADHLTNIVKSETTRFNLDMLGPVQETFRRYLRPLIQDPRFHEVTLDSVPSAKAGNMDFRLPQSAGSEKGSRAELLLSEGQVSEMSLATLFAASSSYKWSNWNALLLDDPTQYNDLIHATAFFEIIRNLARCQNYQVFLSTHDSQQATFFKRKLSGMKVPFIECRFLSTTKDGIDYTVQRSS